MTIDYTFAHAAACALAEGNQGGFAERLAHAFFVADSRNAELIVTTWPDLFAPQTPPAETEPGMVQRLQALEAEMTELRRELENDDLPLRVARSLSVADIVAELDLGLVASRIRVADVAEALDMSELAEHIAGDLSLSELAEAVAGELDVSDIAGELDVSDIASHVDTDQLNEELRSELSELASNMRDALAPFANRG